MANDFTRNPAGNMPTPPKPHSFTVAPPEKSKQKPYDGFELDQKSQAAGGPDVLKVATPKVDAGNPIGTGPRGTNRLPFSVG